MEWKANGKVFNYFSKYGQYSLIIYLIHAPAISVARVLMFKFLTPNVFIAVFTLFFVGWISSLIFVFLYKKFDVIKFIFSPLHFLIFEYL